METITARHRASSKLLYLFSALPVTSLPASVGYHQGQSSLCGLGEPLATSVPTLVGSLCLPLYPAAATSVTLALA